MVRKHFSSLSDPALSKKTGHNEHLIVNSDELSSPCCSYSETATNKSRDERSMEQSAQRKSKSSKSRTRLFPKCTFFSSESDAEKELDLSDTSEFDESDGEIIEGDFVVVKVKGQSRFLNYIERVDVIDDLECEGVFLRRIPVALLKANLLLLLTQWMKLPGYFTNTCPFIFLYFFSFRCNCETVIATKPYVKLQTRS